HCVFCYNPTDFANTGPELGTGDWIRVLRQARALGAVQLGLSGGEPLAREDLEPIVAQAHTLGFYINLITSGIGMTEARIRALKAAGLDHIQLSFQDSTRQLNDFLSIASTSCPAVHSSSARKRPRGAFASAWAPGCRSISSCRTTSRPGPRPA